MSTSEVVVIIILTIVIIVIVVKISMLIIDSPLYPACFSSYQKADKIDINKILVGVPCIDRDEVCFERVYSALIDSLNTSSINYDLYVVTRVSDKKTIQFWSDKANIVTVDHYEIDGRHNFKRMATNCNILRNIVLDKEYNALLMVESDICLNKYTIHKHLQAIQSNHVTVSYFDIPWAGRPVVCKQHYLYPKTFNPHNKIKRSGELIIATGTGCILIRREVLEEIKFNVAMINGIEGQDISFFIQCYHKCYRVYLCNDYVTHLYKRD